MPLSRIFLFLMALCASPALAQRGGGQEVGNGGDPLQLIFRKARVDAVSAVTFFAAKVENSADGLQEQFDRDVLMFLTRLHEGEQVFRHLRKDIENSEHLFIDPDLTGIAQSTCARTNLPDSLPSLIRFSMPHCRMAIIEHGEYLALKILIHESTHHFGIGGSAAEEDFAWRVAEDLFSFWIFSQQQHAPMWKPLPLNQAPIARYDAASTSFGEGNVLVWGGCNFSQLPHRESCEHFLDSGSVLKIDGNGTSWSDVSEEQAPSGRKLATAVYTGLQSQPDADQKVIIFGGCQGLTSACSVHLADGGIYDPRRNLWTTLPESAAIRGRIYHSSIWTGTELIVYGGQDSNNRSMNDMHILSFSAQAGWTWREVDVPPQFKGRYGHSATWTDQGMVVFGGCARAGIIRCQEKLRDGFLFDPGTEDFTATPPLPQSIDGRLFHSAIWSGSHLVIWGGQKDFGIAHNDGAILTLTKDSLSWTPIAAILPTGEQSGRYWHQATWTGHSMLVYGGESAPGTFASTTLKFEFLPDHPDQQSWSLVSTPASPIARKGHVQAWIKDYLVIWGGFGDDQTFLPTGAVLENAR